MPAGELFGPDAIRAAVGRIGSEISRDHPKGVVMVSVLKGSVMFLADLVRSVDVPVEVDFLSISHFAADSGRVRIVKDLDLDIAGLDVVLVEDIVDTGLTSTFLLGHLRALGPRRLRMCTLLDRVRRRIVPVEVEYQGFEIDDEFVLGYGLDFDQYYRNLDRIVVGDLQGLRDDPTHHVPELYGHAG